jgi:hypothetical protein
MRSVVHYGRVRRDRHQESISAELQGSGCQGGIGSLMPRSYESLPYLIRYLADGREVLVSRDYRALWMRKRGRRTVTQCWGQKRLPPWVHQQYLYSGRIANMRVRLLKIEKSFIKGREIEPLFCEREME